MHGDPPERIAPGEKRHGPHERCVRVRRVQQSQVLQQDAPRDRSDGEVVNGEKHAVDGAIPPPHNGGQHERAACQVGRGAKLVHGALQCGGVLRIIVPDMRKYIEAYLADDWTMLNEIGCGGGLPQSAFATKMEALNHVFVQDGEHYGGFDAEYLRRTLEQAGFADIEQVGWREGRFPEGPIDRGQHRPYSLFMEARR